MIGPCLSFPKPTHCPVAELTLLDAEVRTSPRRPDVQYVRMTVRLVSRGAPADSLLDLQSFRLVSAGSTIEAAPLSDGPPSCRDVRLPADGEASCDLWFEIAVDQRTVSLRYRNAGHSLTTAPVTLAPAPALAPALVLVPGRVTVASAIPDGGFRARILPAGTWLVELDVTLDNRDLLGFVAKTEHFTMAAAGTTFPAESVPLSSMYCDGFFDDVPALGSHSCGLSFEIAAGSQLPRLVFDDAVVHAEVDVVLPPFPLPDPTGRWTLTFEMNGEPRDECVVDAGLRVTLDVTMMFLQGTCTNGGFSEDLAWRGPFDRTTARTTLSGDALPACDHLTLSDSAMFTIAADGQTLAGSFDCFGAEGGTVAGVRVP